MSSPKTPLRKALQSIGKTTRILKKGLEAPQKVRSVMSTVKARRVARRETSGLHLVLADRFDLLNTADWDSITRNSAFLSPQYLRVLESHSPANLTTRYAMAYQETPEGVMRPLSAMLFQRLTLSADRLRRTGGRLVSKPASRIKEQLLIGGNVLVCGARSMAVAEGADPDRVWHGLGEALYRLRRADKLLGETGIILVKDLAADSDEARDKLRLLGYRSVETEPDMVLALLPHWRTYDDYLADLTSSYRSAAKKLDKDCSAAGVQLRLATAAEMVERAEELHGLYLQVHDAQDLRMATLTPGYLPAMAVALGERFVCRVAEQGGRWMGFLCSVIDGSTAVAYFVGYDRELNQQAPLYLALLQHAVEDAIGFGAQRMSMGRTALEPKAKMGCRPEPLACAVRHRVAAMNVLVSAVVRTASHEEPPQRSPFKKGVGT